MRSYRNFEIGCRVLHCNNGFGLIREKVTQCQYNIDYNGEIKLSHINFIKKMNDPRIDEHYLDFLSGMQCHNCKKPGPSQVFSLCVNGSKKKRYIPLCDECREAAGRNNLEGYS